MKPNKKKKRSGLERRQERYGWLFVLPWFIGTVYFFLIPLFQSAIYAVTDVNIVKGQVTYSWVGMQNFVDIFTKDAEFLPDLATSVGNMVYQTLIIMIFSLLMAMLLRGGFRGKAFFRGVFFLPVMIASGVVITILQEQVLMTGGSMGNQDVYLFQVPGFNFFTEQLGMPQAVTELATKITGGFFNIVWKSGVQTVLLLAAVNNIPTSSYEAADIEGATAWEKLWKITFPLISPTILVVLIYSIVDSFTDYSNVIMERITEQFDQGYYEYSTAIGLVYFVIVLLLVGIVNAIVSRKIFYQTGR
ncbi:MAG: sugar ABC transporter permease [Oscillospiraceae bacterium]|nr:sugar ABC transporter permease [Oscillospiraceae bacterium]